MACLHGLRARACAAALVLAAACGRLAEPADGSLSPGPTASPSSTPVVEMIELRSDGLGPFAFGVPMEKVLPALVELIGEPVEDTLVHGDMPYGWGDVDTTVRLVGFDGLRVVFHDWEGYFRDDGVMHLVGWGAQEPRTSKGVVLATPEGVFVGATVADLRSAFGSSLHLPDVDQEGCAGPPWYFAVEPERPWGLIGSLSAPPAEPDARVETLSAGAQREGWTPCWEP